MTLACFSIQLQHYENLPMQYTETFFLSVKIENFIIFFYIYVFNIFAQNIDCGYTLETPRVLTIYVLDQK